PASEQLKLTDKVIQVVTAPSDASIFIDNTEVGKGNIDLIIPMDKCVVLKVVKDGYVSMEQTYCNKEGAEAFPVSATYTLSDRFVRLKTPQDAAIKIKGREVAKGSY